jgi:hypothetical protein
MPKIVPKGKLNRLRAAITIVPVRPELSYWMKVNQEIFGKLREFINTYKIITETFVIVLEFIHLGYNIENIFTVLFYSVFMADSDNSYISHFL